MCIRDSNSEIKVINKAASDLSSDSVMLKKVGSGPYAMLKPGFEKAYNAYIKAIGTDREAFCEKQLNEQRERVRRLARQIAGGTVGEARTIHGWWESELYNQLAWAGAKDMAQLMRA